MKVLVLTGAGISAESGIPTFRGPDGLWEGHPVQDVATPEAFRRDPVLVHRFYNARRRKLLSPEIQPNAAHLALAEFERKLNTQHPDAQQNQFLLVTQNIDDLHQRAGSQRVLPMHGELLKARCVDTGEVFEWRDDLDIHTAHPRHPDRLGRLRPHIVWFGEVPIGLGEIERAARVADVFLSIGTSGVVYPAAGIVSSTQPNCRRIEINLDATPGTSQFEESIRGPASIEVPKLLRQL